MRCTDLVVGFGSSLFFLNKPTEKNTRRNEITIMRKPNPCDLKISKKLGNSYNCNMQRLLIPIRNPTFRQNNIINGGKVGMDAALFIFFGKQHKCMKVINIIPELNAINPMLKACSI